MIALDLDRTTLNREGHLSQENRRALEEAIRAGIYVVPASGRAAGRFPAEIMELPGLEYLITSNGAAVYRMEKKNCKSDTLPSADGGAGSAEMRESGSLLSCLQRFLLQPAMVRKVMELTEQAGITYEALVEGKAKRFPISGEQEFRWKISGDFSGVTKISWTAWISSSVILRKRSG